MILIYYTIFDKPLSNEMFYEYLNTLPDFMKKDILRYKKWEDRQARLFGKLLLQKEMTDMAVSGILEDIKFTEYGKPFLDNHMDFSISHSSGCSICALTTKGKLGVDIESVKDLRLSYFRNYFTKAEWNKIISTNNPITQLFHFWTKKESVIKADGKGLNIPLSDVEVIEDFILLENKKWQITELSIDKKRYKAHLAYNELQSVEMFPVDFCKDQFQDY